ncbi:MAG: hypothetical protein HYW88_00800 [Candidatus Sungbacteria bacterium]|nr:hypothetical protein [Candidatus Sungbacteria bacterium]
MTLSSLLLTACHEGAKLPKGDIKLLDGNVIRCDGGIQISDSQSYICYPSMKSEDKVIISKGLIQEVFYKINEQK